MTALSAQRDYDQPNRLRLFARLINAGPEPVEAPIMLALDGEPVEARTATIPPATASGPGEKPLSLTLEDAASGSTTLTVSIKREDALSADNAASLVIQPPVGARVLVVAPNEPDAPQRLAHQMLVRGLRAVESTSVDEVSAAEYERAAARGDSLSAYDLIVYDAVAPGEPPSVPTLTFGADFPSAGVEVDSPPAGALSAPVAFLSWRRTHPLLEHVSLDSVVISRPLRLSLLAPNAEANVRAEALARGPDGPLIALIEAGPVRRMIVGFPLARSTWPVQVSFPIFIANAVDYLTHRGGGSAGRSHSTTEPVSVRATPGAERVVANGPITVEAPVGEDGSANLGVLPIAGVYEVQGAAADDRLVAVNLLDPGESAIATRDEVDVGGETARAGGVGAAAPREIWRWFLLAGAGLLAIEWLLYAWSMRV